MAINNLYISTPKYRWDLAKNKILDKGNLDKVLNDPIINDYCTSISDITTQNLQKVCKASQVIHLVDIDLDTVSKQDFEGHDQYSYGRLFYELIKVKHKVQNFDFINKFNLDRFNSLLGSRCTDDPVLWTLGCSFTIGEGVNFNERYGYLLGEKLNLPEITLSRSGASLSYAADQLLRSDVRSGDIVVWGLTTIQRFEISKDWELEPKTTVMYPSLPKHMRYWSLDFFDSTTNITLSIHKILQVMNFCSKIGAKLYLVNLLDEAWILPVLKDYEFYLDLTKTFPIEEHLGTYLDTGTDETHPGPLTHKWYAEQIYNFIKEK